MAKAVFVATFHWTRPDGSLGFAAQASGAVQAFPRDFIAVAIKAGAAVPVPRKTGSG